jgi:CRISPR/Cas system-associated endonuclease Cas1
MEDKVYQANRNARQLEADLSREKDEVSDEQYTAVAKALSDVTVIEGEIEKEYFKIFEKILSPKQMFLLIRAENRFAVEMLNHNKRSKAKQGNE